MLPLLCILVEWLQQLRYDQKLLMAKYYSSYTHTHYIHGLKSFVFFISLWNVCAHACIYLISIISSFLNSTKYSILVVLLILVELGCAAFIYFDKSWETVSCVLSFKIWNLIWKDSHLILCCLQEIPTDKTGDFDMIYKFLRENWKIVKWVALGIVIFEVSKKLYDWHMEERTFVLLAWMSFSAFTHTPTEQRSKQIYGHNYQCCNGC